MPERSTSRSVRAGVFATVCVGVSTAGHASMSAHDLPLTAPVAGLVGLYACAWAGAGRERGFGTILGWMLWGQLALHLLFSFVQSTAGGAHGASAHATAAPDAAAAVVGQGGGTGMLAAHVAAALISAWWLRRGEAAFFALVRLLRALLPAVLLVCAGSVPAIGRECRRLPDLAVRPRSALVLRHTVVLRGPPPHAAA